VSYTSAHRLGITTSDVVTFDRCPWAWINSVAIDVRGGYPPPPMPNPMREHMARTADLHRERVIRYLQQAHLAEAVDAEENISAQLSSHPAVLHPKWSWDDPHSPFTITASSDVLIRNQRGEARLGVAKLGHSSMRRVLISAAGGVEGLECSSVLAEPVVDVFFGDGEVEPRDLDDSREEWRVLLSGMAAALSRFEAGASLDWSAGEFDQCGRLGCQWCQDAIARHDDLFRIARIRLTQRQEIRRRGINTLSAFAEASEQDLIRRIGTLTPDELRSLHTQARVQFLSTEHPESAPTIEVIDQSVLEGLAPVREGDLYLDFESDPGYVEWPHDAPFTPNASGPEAWLGLEYLIGVMESGTELYRHWWSQSFSEEARRFREFLHELHLRHHNDPDFRVFHYAPYEVNALSRLAERHGYGSDIVENLVEKGVLVDLYKVVMRSIAVGSPSYSLKKLEALYFSGTEREGITQGADSVMAFTRYHELVIAAKPESESIRGDILEYNRVDCLSTKRLHQWLLSLART